MFPTRTPQAASAAARISGSSGSAQLKICRGAIRSRPARGFEAQHVQRRGIRDRKSGWAALSPATISSVASVTGKRTFTNSGLANVLASAAVACVKCAAATQPRTTGRDSSSGRDHLARSR